MGHVRIAALICLALAGLNTTNAQVPGAPESTLTVRTTSVLVPTLVKTNKGAVVLDLTARDFALTDDGVPQTLTLDPETDSLPLALVICVQTGGAGTRHLEDYDRLDAILTSLIGGVEHRVAVVGFDSTPHLLLPFTPETSQASLKLSSLKKGNSGAAILDGVAFALGQLRAQPPGFRRAILLISETIDQGSQTSLSEALRLISDTNTTLYSFGFSTTRADLAKGAPGIHAFGIDHPNDPGPPHGCFSREGADSEYDGHYSRQVLDCLGTLAPPIRIATMLFLTARNGLRTNTAAQLADLTGGEFFRFSNAKDLREALVTVTNDVLNYYVLGFKPTSPTPGLHTLHLEIKGRQGLNFKTRPEYWIDE